MAKMKRREQIEALRNILPQAISAGEVTPRAAEAFYDIVGRPEETNGDATRPAAGAGGLIPPGVPDHGEGRRLSITLRVVGEVPSSAATEIEQALTALGNRAGIRVVRGSVAVS